MISPPKITMATALHSTDAQLVAKHQTSMLASLSHRLEVAKATNNLQLVELLEREQQQVVSRSRSSDAYPITWQSLSQQVVKQLKSLKTHLMPAITRSSQLHVSHFAQGSDEWWYAFNPQTGQCVYADSEAELRLWIKENYQGQ